MQLSQRFASPTAIFRHFKFADVDIPVQQSALVERPLFAVHLSRNIARTQVVDEDALHHDATLLDAAGCYHQHHHGGTDADNQRIGKAREEIDDIEDESQCYHEAHEHRKEQWHAVDAALHPEAFPLGTVVLLHHDGAQER